MMDLLLLQKEVLSLQNKNYEKLNMKNYEKHEKQFSNYIMTDKDLQYEKNDKINMPFM